MRKTGIWIAVIMLAPIVYNLDAIAGRWKFERLCKAEGGSRFLAPIDKDVGWEVEGHDIYDYQWPFNFGDVAFVRYTDKLGIQTDVRTNGYLGSGQRTYIFSPIDKSLAISYRFRYTSGPLPNDQRFSKTEYQVVDSNSGRVVASHTEFGYQWTTPERVLLAMPTAVGCRNLKEDLEAFFHGIHSFGR